MTDTAPPLLALTTEIVAAYLGRHQVPTSQVPEVIQSVYDSLKGLTVPVKAIEPAAKLEPAVSIKKSVTPDYVVCLEDGKKLKMLKRHLATAYGMTPDAYRQKWGLPSDYPMVAPNYAATRSALAKNIGLGRRAAPVPEPVAELAPKRRGRKKAAA